MADIALSTLQTLFSALQSPEVRGFLSKFRPNLEELEKTVSTIKNVLLDADSTNVKLTREQESYIDELKDAIYDADDLFDELRTKAQLKKLKNNDKLSKKVHTFFTSQNPLLSAAKISGEVNRIRKRLDDIAVNHATFGFKIDCQPLRERREETCSYVNSPDIIGREDDIKAIVDRLLNDTVKETVGFLTIVGMGGLGKTTLAQLVYNDDKIEGMFESRFWVCVSDQDGKGFDVKAILSKILELVDRKPDDGSSLEKVVNMFQGKLRGNQCLIILDDVWTEDPLEWRKLKSYLMALGMGSKIIATSRSKKTAEIIGDGHARTYVLAGLCEENSWNLFKKAAFTEVDANTNEVLETGVKIVEQCFGVPLAIKVLGSLLYGQKISKWREVEKNGLQKISQDDNRILSILKLSYDNLDSSLKACFSYCAIFPKDFIMEKEDLINLWLAQGYIMPFYEGQSTNGAGNEQFSILLRRCFFQDVTKDKYGEVENFKVHDLMHDVAQQVAGKEISFMGSNSRDQKMRHVYSDGRELTNSDLGKMSYVRSFLNVDASSFLREFNPRHLMSLRALSLKGWRNDEFENVPRSLWKLLHLRYLSFKGFRRWKRLPKSITELYNLQTLILIGCSELRELPNDLSMLVNLRHLDISLCRKLNYMPAGMDKLTCLEILTDFYVAKRDVSFGGRRNVGQLKDLKALKNLRGHIVIRFPDEGYLNLNDDERDFLYSVEHLRKVKMRFLDTCLVLADHKASHPYVNKFVMDGYNGRIIQVWCIPKVNWATWFGNLVEIKIEDCSELEHLPLMSALQHLRSLLLYNLPMVEYMEENTCNISAHGSMASCSTRPVAQSSFFPSLEILEINEMGNLKGWWRMKSGDYNDESEGGGVLADVSGGDISSHWQSYSFPRLKALKITECRNLISFPLCPKVETLDLRGLNEKLEIKKARSGGNDSNILLKLRYVTISHVGDLRALPPCNPTTIHIEYCSEETFSGAGVEDVFRTRGSSSLRHLHLRFSKDLKSVAGGGFQHLTALESIQIHNCRELILNSEDNNDGIAWTSLQHSLLSFRLWDSHMERLPKGMQYLTSLQHLKLYLCKYLEELPEWISCLSSLHTLKLLHCKKIKSIPNSMLHLTSLHQLDIYKCSKELHERCRRVPQGEDFPKIQHIPQLSVTPWGRGHSSMSCT